MNWAMIDLGSNTIRLCVYEYAEGRLNTIVNQKETVGLAGYVSGGALTKEGIAKACEVLPELVALAGKFVAQSQIRIVATASLRNIANCDAVLAAIIECTQIVPDVLTGEDEALFEFAGASHQIQCDEGLLVDIGGGSTELVLFENGAPVHTASMPIGCLQLYKMHVSGFMPDSRERKAIKKEVDRFLSATELTKDCPVMLGTGGTLRACAKLSKAVFKAQTEDAPLDASDVIGLYDLFKSPNRLMYDAIIRAIPERAFTIVSGIILLRQIIKRFGCKTIHVSAYGVREGYLLKRVIGGQE